MSTAINLNIFCINIIVLSVCFIFLSLVANERSELGEMFNHTYNFKTKPNTLVYTHKKKREEKTGCRLPNPIKSQYIQRNKEVKEAKKKKTKHYKQ